MLQVTSATVLDGLSSGLAGLVSRLASIVAEPPGCEEIMANTRSERLHLSVIPVELIAEHKLSKYLRHLDEARCVFCQPRHGGRCAQACLALFAPRHGLKSHMPCWREAGGILLQPPRSNQLLNSPARAALGQLWNNQAWRLRLKTFGVA